LDQFQIAFDLITIIFNDFNEQLPVENTSEFLRSTEELNLVQIWLGVLF